MKIKLDENLPESLLVDLSALGHDVDNVRMEGLHGAAEALDQGRGKKSEVRDA